MKIEDHGLTGQIFMVFVFAVFVFVVLVFVVFVATAVEGAEG